MATAFTIKKAAAPESTGVTPFTAQYIYDAALAPLGVGDSIDVCDLDIGTVVESVDLIPITQNTDNTATLAVKLNVATTEMIAAADLTTRRASTRTTTGYAAAANEVLRMTCGTAATTNLKVAVIVHGFVVPAVTKTNSLTAVA